MKCPMYGLRQEKKCKYSVMEEGKCFYREELDFHDTEKRVIAICNNANVNGDNN